MKTIRPITAPELKQLRAEPTGSVTDLMLKTWVVPLRIVQRISVDARTGCWRVRGANSGNGYAKLSITDGEGNWRQKAVHLVVYELLVGPIPAGKILDHKKDAGCEHRDCCCPFHLEPVTVRENTDRGRGKHTQFKRRV